MRGTIHNQIESLFHSTAKGIKVSRHKMKIDRQEDNKIHSDNTRHTYLRVWHLIAKHAKDHFNVTQLTDVTPEMASAWFDTLLTSKLAPATYRTFLSAASKLFAAIESYKAGKTDSNNNPSQGEKR